MQTISANRARVRRQKPALRLSTLVCFLALTTGTFVAAHEFANRLTLRMAYGVERVQREHLYVVKDKNEITVSNGDVLPSRLTTIDRITMVGGWFLLAGPLLIIVLRSFPDGPQPLPGKTPVVAVRLMTGLTIVMLVGLFFLIMSRPFVESEIIAAVVGFGSLGYAWIKRALFLRLDIQRNAAIIAILALEITVGTLLIGGYLVCGS